MCTTYNVYKIAVSFEDPQHTYYDLKRVHCVMITATLSTSAKTLLAPNEIQAT